MQRWDPFTMMEAMHREIDRAYRERAGDRAPGRWHTAFLPGLGARQYPLVNLSDDAQNVYVEALAPGVDPKSLDLSVAQGTLTISGEKPGLAQVTAEAYHRNERAAGRFTRTIDLPADVDAARVSAEYRNGLLVIALPKSEEAKPRQIPISVM
ncbi:MAG: Hsp20/alpha crystallin family protein [candidate division NC10 bacterium]|nr:Hsp20/alpha crystallin family protein [candidate division NC10 bacterium]